jgi:peptide/nickel transport system permease protein
VAEMMASTSAAPAKPAVRKWLEPGLLLAVAWLLVLLVLAVLAPWLGLVSPEEADLLATLESPGAEHWLGTDSLGRDTLSRLIWGGRVSLVVAVGSVAIGLAIGGALGLVAGFFGAMTDRLIMGVMTVMRWSRAWGRMWAMLPGPSA